jgi:DNA repair protein RadC
MSEKELLNLMVRIAHRKAEAEEARQKLAQAADAMFDEHQANIEKLRLLAARGDQKAQAAYMALLRGRGTLSGTHREQKVEKT